MHESGWSLAAFLFWLLNLNFGCELELFMSAIFGIFRFDKQPIEIATLKRLATVLGKYGSDGHGTWLAPAGEAIGLGHILMRITPEDDFEKQPLTSRDGQLVLVADGRIDNRTELGKQLNISLEQQKTLPDSAFILAAFEKWGENCPNYLLGDFSFIVWDRRSQVLFCARDQTGERPLFYYRNDKLLVLATATKALFALPEVPRQLNETKLLDFLLLIPEDTSTFYEQVYQLPAAHRLRADCNGIDIHSYWSPIPRQQIKLRSDDDYVEAFLEIFIEAVRCRLRSAGPIGAFMSGGLDSSSVAAVAAQQLGQQHHKLTTFTAVPRQGFSAPNPSGWFNDETSHVQAIQESSANLEINLIRTTNRTPLDNLSWLYETFDQPILHACNWVWLKAILEAAQTRQLRVLLHGGQGNLTISYDGWSLLPELVLNGRWLKLASTLPALARSRQCSQWTIIKQRVLAPLLPKTLWLIYWYSRNRPALPWSAHAAANPALVKEKAMVERCRQLDIDLTGQPPRNSVKHRLEMLTRTSPVSGYLYSAVRSGFNLELRDPTADRRIVEFCFGIPTDQYLRGGSRRHLIRRAMKGVLPDMVRLNNQRGLQGADWYEGLNAAYPQVVSLMKRLEQSDTAQRCLDLPRMRRLVDRWPQGNWTDPTIETEYRSLLLRGLMMGGFILWFEQGKL